MCSKLQESSKENKTSRYPYKGSSGVLPKGLVSMRPTTTGPGFGKHLQSRFDRSEQD